MKMTPRLKRIAETAASVMFILLLWQIGASLLDNKILLVSPVDVIIRMGELIGESGFISSLMFSFVRIVIGFAAALVSGCLLGALASRFRIVDILLRPIMVTVKSVPVASFIILALIWLDSSSLSMFISFLMVLPVVYTNVLTGIGAIPKVQREMADVFDIPWGKRLIYIALPNLKPYIISACTVSLGLSWKAGIAAEVIGIPSGSIGERLYQAKLYLETPDLFAWTVYIVLISVIFEKLFLLLVKGGYRLLER